MDKPDTGTWNSVDDALKTLYSMSRVTKGCGPKSGEYSLSNHSAGNSRTINHPDSSQNQSLNHSESSSDEEIIDETPMFGAGRGQYLKNLEKKFGRQRLDEEIHGELRQLFGPGHSNVEIENYHASVSSVCGSSSESSTQETREFSPHYLEEREKAINFDFGESNIMKKIAAQQNCSFMKKKPPRCRNVIVLNCTQNKTSNETEINTKKTPELKGPDVFLRNKPYSSVVTSVCSSKLNPTDSSVFDDADFPAL
nr:uncharacterized protein LOC106678215 isoform X2 [Halyomorpha halys]